MEEEVEYIIVGQGLAGTILAFSALLQGKKIKIIASDELQASSKVAAGIINSVVIKRLTKSWRADDFNPFIQTFYPRLEEFIEHPFFRKSDTLKLISSEEEEQFWISRRIKNDLSDYLSEEIYQDKLSEAFYLQKAGDILQTYLIDVNLLLGAFRKKMELNDILRNEIFEYQNLIIESGQVKYKNLKAKQIIFAEGFHATSNPFFNWLPFTLNKGEILEIKSKNLQSSSVINKKIFILPMGNSIYKIGSSFEWDKLDENPTVEKRKEISEEFNKMSSASFEIMDQVAGIRPATKDRRPFLGQHPKFPNFHIFNGMGAKAGLMAPLLSKELLANIEEGIALHPESAIERHKKLYQVYPVK